MLLLFLCTYNNKNNNNKDKTDCCNYIMYVCVKLSSNWIDCYERKNEKEKKKKDFIVTTVVMWLMINKSPYVVAS